jgi:hypothetical protein
VLCTVLSVLLPHELYAGECASDTALCDTALTDTIMFDTALTHAALFHAALFDAAMFDTALTDDALPGITTDEPHLKLMAARITDHALTSAALEAHGIQSLQSRIRTTDGGAAVSDVAHSCVHAQIPPTSAPKQTGGLDLCAVWTGSVCLLIGCMGWICVLIDWLCELGLCECRFVAWPLLYALPHNTP